MSEQRSVAGFARFLAFVFSLLLTLALLLCLLQLTLSQTLFSARFVKTVLVEEKAYEALPGLVTQTMLNSVSGTGEAGLGILAQVPADQLSQWMSTVLPADYLQTQTDQVIESLEAFINLRSYTLNLQFDLTPVKANLASPASADALANLLDSMPACTADQLNELLAATLKQGSLNGLTIPMCKPAEPLLSVVRALLSGTVSSFAAVLPDSLAIGGEAVQAQVNSFVMSRQYTTYYLFKRILEYTPWVCLGLALLIVLFTLRSKKLLLASLGTPLWISGLVGLLAAGLVYLGRGYVLLVPMLSQSSSAFVVFARGFALHTIGRVSLIGALISAAFFVIGLTFSLISRRAK